MTLNDRVTTQGGKEGVIVNMEVGNVMTVKFPNGTVGVYHEDLLTITRPKPPEDTTTASKGGGLKVMETKEAKESK